MVFSSFLFLFLFLPLFLACYYAAPDRYKNLVALIFSCAFYGWGAPAMLPLLISGCLLDFWLSGRLAPGVHPERTRKLALALGIAVNLACLGYYKYANFFVDQVNVLLHASGTEQMTWTAIALPIGISFFTFQKISYLVDVYRGETPRAQSAVDYVLYIALFPQLIAGPIVRYHDVAMQIEQREHTLDDFFEGMRRFSLGLAKKVLIADSVGAVADNVFALKAAQLSPEYAWLGIICYSFQIYFDFSGYSDMAIGLARMIGIRFLENFLRPYRSHTFTEFWRRWHVSLSNFMREYLYIPLGGNRGAKWRTYVNLWIVFLLSGLWHGAAWTFVLWGIYHGTFLALEKLGWGKVLKRLPSGLSMTYTFLLVTIGWVFFRAENVPAAFQYLGAMFDLTQLGAGNKVFRADIIHNRGIAMLFLAFLFTFIPGHPRWENLLNGLRRRCAGAWQTAAAGSFALACLLLSIVALAPGDYSPFLYFKF